MADQIFEKGSKVKVDGQIFKVIEAPKNLESKNFGAFYTLLNTWTKDTILVHNRHVTAFNQYELQKNFYDIMK